jgi:hypothetical protein
MKEEKVEEMRNAYRQIRSEEASMILSKHKMNYLYEKAQLCEY